MNKTIKSLFNTLLKFTEKPLFIRIVTKTNVLCLIMCIATGLLYYHKQINLSILIELIGFWLLQAFLRDSNYKIQKASKYPVINKDTSRFV